MFSLMLYPLLSVSIVPNDSLNNMCLLGRKFSTTNLYLLQFQKIKCTVQIREGIEDNSKIF